MNTPGIRPAVPDDAAEIARIYNHYVMNTVVTFEEQPVRPDLMAQRMAEVSTAALPWLVAETDGRISDGRISGFAYAGTWKSRCAYRFTVESTIYLDPDCIGRGIGRTLYTGFLDALRLTPMRSVLAGIALPNPASIALHESLGFRKVAHFSEVGFKFGQWIDIGYWQLALR
jgi:L-amino acid N-acyltransferase YncA